MNCSARYTISWHRIERRTSEKGVKLQCDLKYFNFRPSDQAYVLIFCQYLLDCLDLEYFTQYSGSNSSVIAAVLGSIFIEGELWRRTEGDDGKSKNGLIFEGRTNVD